MSTDIAQNTNRLIAETNPIFQFIEAADISRVRIETEVDWERNVVLRCEARLRDVLLLMKLAQQMKNGELTVGVKGRAFLGKLLLGLDDQLDHRLKERTAINDRYLLQGLLASGKNSLAYKAHDRRLGRPVVLKFFRPGRGEGTSLS
jgi:hypothetical protein